MFSLIKLGLGWLFGGSATANSVVTSVESGLDKSFYTTQEKAENNNKLLGYYLDYLKTTSPQNVARRIVAFMVVGLWCLLVFVAVIAWPFMPKYSDFIFGTLKNVVNDPFMIIIGFYFAVHFVRGITQSLSVQNKDTQK